MPTATAVFNATLTNLGPVTATFTPAPSCTALPSQSDAGFLFFYKGQTDQIYGVKGAYGPVACAPQDFASCLPGGTARQSILAHDNLDTIPYHSPGLYCPAGWSAVATATASVAWDAYTGAAVPEPSGINLAVTGFAMLALAPSEAVTICCPSGYTAAPDDFIYRLGCTSSLGPASSYGISERCFNDRPVTTKMVTFFDRVITKIEPIADAPTKYTQLPLKETSDGWSFEVYHTVPNVVLINGGGPTETAPPRAASTAKGDGKDGKKSAGAGQRASVRLVAAVTILVAAGSFWGLL